MQPLTKVSEIIIHHSQNDGHTFESIKQLHISMNGWEDIGYHWLIDSEGNLIQGRSENFQGAQVYGHNKESLGICLIGNLDSHPPTSEQIKTLINFLKHKLKQHNISTENIFGHNDFPDVKKTCPGKFLDLDLIRGKVSS